MALKFIFLTLVVIITISISGCIEGGYVNEIGTTDVCVFPESVDLGGMCMNGVALSNNRTYNVMNFSYLVILKESNKCLYNGGEYFEEPINEISTYYAGFGSGTGCKSTDIEINHCYIPEGEPIPYDKYTDDATISGIRGQGWYRESGPEGISDGYFFRWIESMPAEFQWVKDVYDENEGATEYWLKKVFVEDCLDSSCPELKVLVDMLKGCASPEG